jgi:hypothetical protein
MLTLKPWYRDPASKAIGAASARQTQAITARAQAKILTKTKAVGGSGYGPAT